MHDLESFNHLSFFTETIIIDLIQRLLLTIPERSDDTHTNREANVADIVEVAKVSV